MKKVLITGSSGFLGQHLLKIAPGNTHLTAQYFHNNPGDEIGNIRLFQADFTKAPWELVQKMRPDIIIHTAAMAEIDECESYPAQARKMNITVTSQLADLAELLGCRFIFISSDVVFDGKRGGYNEEDQPHPINVYAETKTAAEQYILQNNSRAVIIRPALFYGPSFNARPSFTEVMLQRLRNGQKVNTFIDQYRSPISVRDLAHAIWELVDHDYCGLLHVGGPQRLNRHEMGITLCELFKLDVSLLVPVRSSDIPLKALRPLDCSLDSTRAVELLKTRFSDFEEGLRQAF